MSSTDTGLLPTEAARARSQRLCAVPIFLGSIVPSVSQQQRARFLGSGGT
jgi:hypothetical protein